MSIIRIGSHVSIRKGYLHAAKTSLSMGARAFQYFPKNPRSLSIKSFDDHDAQACADFCVQHDLLSIAHSPYPTNLAANDSASKQAMIQSIINDLHITEACGSLGLVVHFGKYKGKDPLQGYKNSLQCLNDVLSVWNGKSLLLIENQAGEGTPMGTTFEELVQIRELSEYPEKIAFCLDTCHAFASGLFREDDWLEWKNKADELGYLEQLKAIHLNDSMYPSGSLRDRHANIGKGFIGEKRMRELLNEPVLQDIPFILETPSSQNYSHQHELAFIHEMIDMKG
jgi:deoxyribonuclease-4